MMYTRVEVKYYLQKTVQELGYDRAKAIEFLIAECDAQEKLKIRVGIADLVERFVQLQVKK